MSAVWTTFEHLRQRTDVVNVLTAHCAGRVTVAHSLKAHAGVSHLWCVVEGPAGVPRHIVLYLIQRGERGWEARHVEESEGPDAYDCPLAFLTLTPQPPLHGLHALGWRRRVRDHWQGRLSA